MPALTSQLGSSQNLPQVEKISFFSHFFLGQSAFGMQTPFLSLINPRLQIHLVTQTAGHITPALVGLIHDGSSHGEAQSDKTSLQLHSGLASE